MAQITKKPEGDVEKRITMLKIAHQRGQVSDDQFHGDVKDILDASDLPHDEKIRLHRETTGNIYR